MAVEAKLQQHGGASAFAAAASVRPLAKLAERMIPRSYHARVWTAIACVLLPAQVLVAWLAWRADLPRESLVAALSIGLLASLCGAAAAAWLLLHVTLRPLRRAARALERYERDRALPAWSAAEQADDEFGRLLHGLQRCLNAVHAGQRQLERHALEDPLTRAMNRRGAMRALQASVDLAATRAGCFILLVVDLDNLKDINDRHGHAAGDYALASVVTSAEQCCLAEGDWIARWGGDEFLLGLHADPQIAFDRVRVWIDVLGRPAEEGLPVLVSVGAALAEPGLDADTLYRRADAAMYRAKAAGGRRLLAWDRDEDAAACA
jgi:diguanylate cyclase (GGDEF)-like protein